MEWKVNTVFWLVGNLGSKFMCSLFFGNGCYQNVYHDLMSDMLKLVEELKFVTSKGERSTPSFLSVAAFIFETCPFLKFFAVANGFYNAWFKESMFAQEALKHSRVPVSLGVSATLDDLKFFGPCMRKWIEFQAPLCFSGFNSLEEKEHFTTIPSQEDYVSFMELTSEMVEKMMNEALELTMEARKAIVAKKGLIAQESK